MKSTDPALIFSAIRLDPFQMVTTIFQTQGMANSGLWLRGIADYVLPAFPINHPEYGPMLTMATSEEAVYITKAQAMAFFDLVERT